jgi:trimethylamine:corrinoid methyltransferase-like protein
MNLIGFKNRAQVAVETTVPVTPEQEFAADPLALIREGMAQGTFIGTDDTVTRFRDFYAQPDLFRNWNLGRWKSEGSPNLLDEAWARAQEEMKKSTFQLTPEREKAVDEIYKKACAYTMKQNSVKVVV